MKLNSKECLIVGDCISYDTTQEKVIFIILANGCYRSKHYTHRYCSVTAWSNVQGSSKLLIAKERATILSKGNKAYEKAF